MAKEERRKDREDFIRDKIINDPYMTSDMAKMLFNWNTDHSEKEVTDSLLEDVRKKAIEKEGNIGRLASRNSVTRNEELIRILGIDFLNYYKEDRFFKGFWRSYLLSFLNGEKTIEEIRKENCEPYQPKTTKKNEKVLKLEESYPEIDPEVKTKDGKDKNLFYEVIKRYPQFGYLSEETKQDILKEVKEDLERGGKK